MTTFGILVRLTRLILSADLGARRSLIEAFALEALVIAMGVAGPYALKLLIDTLAGPVGPPMQLLLYILLFVGCWAGASILETARLSCTAKMVDALARKLKTNALGAALPQITAARDSQSGRVPGVLERLPYSLTLVVEGLIWRLGPVFLQALASLAVIASLIEPRYVLILGVTLLGFLGATWMGAARHRVHADAANAAASHVSRTIGDIVRNARRVILNGALDRELHYVGGTLSAKRQASAAMYRSLTVMAALQFCIVGAGLVALLMLAGLDVGKGRMTAGEFVLLQTYAFRLTVPLSSLGYILAQAGVAIANIRDVLALTNAEDERGSWQPDRFADADLAAENLSFRYDDGLPALAGISLHIASGRFVAIVGANGSGKSTLAQILAGVLAPASGRVEIAGVDIATIPWGERHRYILYAPQFIGLFNRSLRENILYPPAHQPIGDVEELLHVWRFHEPGRPIDFDMELGEQGERLSGGQIQKLELARLAGVDVPVLILDESTSALDPRSEADVIARLRCRTNSATTLIMITHRLATAKGADQVLFMNGGELVDSGTHAELMRRCVTYQDLWLAPQE